MIQFSFDFALCLYVSSRFLSWEFVTPALISSSVKVSAEASSYVIASLFEDESFEKKLVILLLPLGA